MITNPESTEQMKETASVLFSVMSSADSYTVINECLLNEDISVDQTTKSSTGIVTKPGDVTSYGFKVCPHHPNPAPQLLLPCYCASTLLPCRPSPSCSSPSRTRDLALYPAGLLSLHLTNAQCDMDSHAVPCCGHAVPSARNTLPHEPSFKTRLKHHVPAGKPFLCPGLPACTADPQAHAPWLVIPGPPTCNLRRGNSVLLLRSLHRAGFSGQQCSGPTRWAQVSSKSFPTSILTSFHSFRH